MSTKSVYMGVLSNVFGSLLMLAATVWLTRLVSPEQFGEFRVGANFATLLVPFLALGGERVISKLIQRRHDSGVTVARALVTVLVITGTGIAMLLAAYPLLTEWAFDGNVSLGVYVVSLLLVPLTIAYNLANTIWRHVGDPAAAQVHLNFTQRLLRAPLLIGTALAWPSALASSLSMAVAQAISLFQIRKNLLRYPINRAGSIIGAVRESARGLLVIGLPVAFMAAVDRLDVLLVNHAMGVSAAGTYDLIFMLALTAMFPAMALSKTTEPMLYELAGDVMRHKRLHALHAKSFLLSCAAVLGIAVLAPLLVSVLGNADPDFVSAALLLATGIAFSGGFGPVLEYMQINGKSRITMTIVIVLLAVFLALKYLVAVSGSLVGVAALSGLFYFVLRAALAIYIYSADRIFLARREIVLISIFGYFCVAAYFLYMAS